MCSLENIWTMKQNIISIMCQGYFVLFSLITMVVTFKITLPEFVAGDADLLLQLKILAWFIFLNIIGNYICIRVKAPLSNVKPLVQNSRSLLLNIFENEGSPQLLPVSSSPFPSPLYDGRHFNLTSHRCSEDIDKRYINTNSKESKRQSSLFHAASVKNNAVDIYTGHGDTLTEIVGGWTSCKECGVLAPPRAKHCPICKRCIMKRGHHCFFSGCCIGFHNQRYFFIFCMYTTLGGLYSFVITSSYLSQHFEAVQTWGYFAYLFPVVLWLWISRSTEGYIVAMVILNYWSLIGSLTCGYYFLLQVFLIIRGQTCHEYWKGIRTYRGTVKKNVSSVFGKNWPIGFFFPAPFSDYRGDGVNWDDVCSESKVL